MCLVRAFRQAALGDLCGFWRLSSCNGSRPRYYYSRVLYAATAFPPCPGGPLVRRLQVVVLRVFPWRPALLNRGFLNRGSYPALRVSGNLLIRGAPLRRRRNPGARRSAGCAPSRTRVTRRMSRRGCLGAWSPRIPRWWRAPASPRLRSSRYLRIGLWTCSSWYQYKALKNRML